VEPMASPAIMVPSISGMRSCRKITWSVTGAGFRSHRRYETYFGFSDLLGTTTTFSTGREACPATATQSAAFI